MTSPNRTVPRHGLEIAAIRFPFDWPCFQRCFFTSLLGMLMTVALTGCFSSDSDNYREMTDAELKEIQAERDQADAPQENSSKSEKDEQTSQKTTASESASQSTDRSGNQQPSAKRSAEPIVVPVAGTAVSDASGEAKKVATAAGSDSAAKQDDPEAQQPQLARNSSNLAMRQKLMNRGRNLDAVQEQKEMEPREPKLLIKSKSFQKEGAENALRVTFDDIDLLKVLNMEPVPENAPEMFPDWLSDLDGKRVLIRGFMYPTMSKSGITYFQHVRDNEICCFGRKPKIYDRIATSLKPDSPTDYIQGRPYDVLGTFRITPIYEDGEWLQLYALEEAEVIDN